MNEQVVKYMAQNARVFCVTLSDAIERTAQLNPMDTTQRVLLGKLETFVCCIAALQKVDKALIVARMQIKDVGIFSATADKEGLVRGTKEPCGTGESYLEVTLQLHLRGNYTGVVTGDTPEALFDAYFSQSLQIASRSLCSETAEGFVFVLAEKLPGAACDLQGLCRIAAETLPFGTVPDGFSFLEAMPLRFGCTCSRGSLLRMVSALPASERAELSENGKIVTHCNSCGKKYTFEM